MVEIYNTEHSIDGLDNQLITYYLLVRYLLRIQQYPMNNTYNKPTKVLISFLFIDCFIHFWLKDNTLKELSPTTKLMKP